MSVREKLFEKLSAKARLITAIISIVCAYYLSVLPSISDRVNVGEDTIMPGRTPAFVEPSDLTEAGTSFSSLELPYFIFNVTGGEQIEYTVVQSKRGDTREAIVVAVDRKLASIGLTVAKSLMRVQWLSRDVYFVFVPETCKTFSYGLREWMSDFYTKPSILIERPLLRAGFAIDRSVVDDSSLLIDYEGINGILSDQDISNLMFEVADELRFPVRVRSVYESALYQGFNGGVHSPHSAFLDAAIPAITLRIPEGSRYSVLQVSQLVGKYVRALSGLQHQLHHSTSVFLYTGFKQDVSFGKIIPLVVGAMSPLFTSILSPDYNNTSHEIIWGMIAFVFSAFFIVGGLSFWLVIRAGQSAEGHTCKAIISAWSLTGLEWIPIIALMSVHLLASRVTLKSFAIDSNELRCAVYKVIAVVMTVLVLFHWSIAAITGLFLVPLTIAAVPLRDSHYTPMRRLLGLVMFLIASLVWLHLTGFLMISDSVLKAVSRGVGDIVTSMRLNGLNSSQTPFELLQFVRETIESYTPKSVGTLVQEFFCVKGLGIVMLFAVILPGLLVIAEVLISYPSITEETAPETKTQQNRKFVAVAVLVSAVAFLVTFIEYE